MQTQESTLARLLEERRLQDEDFRSLCATLESFSPELRFQLAEDRARDLKAAFEFARSPVSRPDAWYSLRA